jgi:mRNA interferase MazF
MQRGELYRVRQPPGDPKQYRTFVVVCRQATIDSKFSTVICAPVFSEGFGAPTQVRIGIDEGMKHESWIWCDGITSIRKSDLTQYVGSLSHAMLVELDRALAVALDLI